MCIKEPKAEPHTVHPDEAQSRLRNAGPARGFAESRGALQLSTAPGNPTHRRQEILAAGGALQGFGRTDHSRSSPRHAEAKFKCSKFLYFEWLSPGCFSIPSFISKLLTSSSLEQVPTAVTVNAMVRNCILFFYLK